MENVTVNYTKIKTDYGTTIIKKETSDGLISIIPLDAANKDYQDYLAQLETE